MLGFAACHLLRNTPLCPLPALSLPAPVPQPDRMSSYVVTRWYRSPEMLVSDTYGAAAGEAGRAVLSDSTIACGAACPSKAG